MEIDESLYEQLHEVMHYDAESLRALALFLNAHKKNREFMRVASAELGRNARHMARAVDYFFPWFTGTPQDKLTADQILSLFAYAQLKHEAAMECFAANKFDFPLHVIRERVAAVRADANGKRERAPSLAERCAALALQWWDIKDGAWAAEQLSALPEVAKVLNGKK